MWTKVHQVSFVQRGRGFSCSTTFQIFDNADPFRRYSRSKSKVDRNRAEFWTFFSPSQILGGRPSKRYTPLHMTIASRHVVWKMFYEDTPTSPEAIVANTLNFKPNFKFWRLKFLGRPTSHFGCALSRLSQSMLRVKISGPWECCPLKFLYALQIDQALLSHTTTVTGVPPPPKKLIVNI